MAISVSGLDVVGLRELCAEGWLERADSVTMSSLENLATRHAAIPADAKSQRF